MKLQRTTLILLLLAIGLGGLVYFSEIRGATQRQEVEAKAQQIFSFAEQEVQAIAIKQQKQTLRFERGEEAGKPVWKMTTPQEAVASDAAVSYLLNLLVTGKSDRRLPISANQLSEYGLTQPQATIEVTLKDRSTQQLILGKPDFNRSFLYAQVNPPAQPTEDLELLFVSPDFENAVKRPLSEWQQSQVKSEPNNTQSTPPANK